MNLTDLAHVTPWILAGVFAVNSVFKRDTSPFLNFSIGFLVIASLYFGYESLIESRIVDSFLNILPLHLAFLLFLSLLFILKKEVNFVDFSEIPFDTAAFVAMTSVLFISGVSFSVGAAFLGYGEAQYFVSGINCITIAGLVVTRYKFSLWITQALSFFILGITITCYLYMSIIDVGVIDMKKIVELGTTFSPPILGCILFFLVVLSSNKLVSEKTWGYILTAFVSVFSLGMFAHHPELGEVAKPMVKEVLQFASVSGSGATLLYAAGVLARAKTGLA